MIRLEFQPAEAKYIRSVLGQCPHDQVNALIVRIEQAMVAPAAPLTPATPPAAGLPVTGDEKH